MHAHETSKPNDNKCTRESTGNEEGGKEERTEKNNDEEKKEALDSLTTWA